MIEHQVGSEEHRSQTAQLLAELFPDGVVAADLVNLVHDLDELAERADQEAADLQAGLAQNENRLQKISSAA